ncbi:MAG: ABC transporter ATP-binding protein [Candidatus Omnitrophica bacterium]|nr:ABC transporter ATP-binding protein [Candidatus Omnitrophota bacterium]
MIKLKNVSKYYKNVMGVKHFTALDDVSLEVKSGEIFGLLGPNGSGKTTLLRLMLGLIFPSKGKISVLGKSPRDVRSKMKIGYLPEQPYFYNFLNPVELLSFYGSLFGLRSGELKKRIPGLLDRVGLSRFRKMRVRNFSKGMMQRAGLAVSLINDPDLLFLDEPTLGLDPIGTNEVQNFLRVLNREGKTIFLCSHLLSEVEDSCSRIGVMNKGKLIKAGRLDELLVAKNELSVVMRGIREADKEKLSELARQSGAEIVSVSRKKDSLKDFFVRAISGEK